MGIGPVSGSPVGTRPGTLARTYMMCPPRYFDVVYRINPWMHPGQPVDKRLAWTQWERLRATLVGLGHCVELIEPRSGFPDMVFTANGGLVVGDRAVAARMAVAERGGEEAHFREWFTSHGLDVRGTSALNEGEGDFRLLGERLLAASGFRTAPAAHDEVASAFGLPVETLELVDPRWYHLDMALAVLDVETVAYYPGAFSPASRRRLAALLPNAVVATQADALAFGLNAISDGHHVVLDAGAGQLAAAIRARGYEPIPLPMSEFHRAGGGAKCCVLELHPPVGSS